MDSVKIENLTIRFGGKKIFDNFSAEFECGKTTAVLGKSGRGKTTLLNEICKRERKSGRKVSFAFQEPRLLEGLSALENVAIPLKNRFGKKEAGRIAEFFLERMNLGEKLDDMAEKMSGGERQRVSLARALAFPSEILLMDEPFSALDDRNRLEIMSFVKETLSASGRTTIFVTHDEGEAEELGERILRI